MKTRLISALALQCALIAPAAGALAAPAVKPAPTMAVRYADLNLEDARDARVMLHRIRKVAVDVCFPGDTGHEGALRFDACYKRAVDDAVARLNAPRVTEALNVVAGERRLARLP